MECCKCKVKMELKRTVFVYLDHEMYHPVPCCPKCGQIFIPPELAHGKMKDVETELEDK